MGIEIVNKHRKTCSILIVAFILMASSIFSSRVAYAEEISTNAVIIDVEVTGDDKGQIKAGTEIEIVYKLSNLKNLYAASIDLTYDNSLITVNSIEPGEKITGSVFEAYRDTAKDGNRARYAFTFLGSDQMGISGKADFVKIKATAIKDGQLDVKKNTTKFQLVQKIDNNMQEVKPLYVNSQGESVKVESNKTESDKKEPASNGSANSGGTGSETSSNSNDNEEKVTILGTDDSVKVVSEEDKSGDIEESGNPEDKNSKEIVSEDKEESTVTDNNENDADNTAVNEESKDASENTSDNNNNLIKIIGVISAVIIIIAAGVYTRKRKNIN